MTDRGPLFPARTQAGADRGVAARQSTVRSANLAAVVRTVLGSGRPLSRADVAAVLGVTRATASRLADELVSAGVLAELEVRNPSGPGRPGTPLAAAAGIGALGLQVNTTFLVARVVNLRGEVVAERRTTGDFRASSPGRVLKRLDALGARLVAEVEPGLELVGTAVALPGLVDASAGMLLVAPNLGWSDVRPGDHLAAGTAPGEEVLLANEADMAARALAEVVPGRPGPLQDYLYLSGETGIGAAVVVQGQIMAGRHGWAGEVGHVCVDPEGPACRCGSTGCLELYAGRQAILAAAGLAEDTSPHEVVTLARAGNADVGRAIDRAAAALAVALGGAVNILDIDVVVLGGHLAQIADVLLAPLEEGLRRRVLSARWAPPRVEVHVADDGIGATGAALTQLNRVIDDPGGRMSRRSPLREDGSG